MERNGQRDDWGVSGMPLAENDEGEEAPTSGAKGANREDLWKLYTLTKHDMEWNLDAHQRRVTFYFGFLSALFVATVAGVINAEYWFHAAFLTFGPMLGLLVVHIAKDGTYRFYRTFIDSVTTLVKIESRLGLDEPGCLSDGPATHFWGNESLITARHEEARKDYRCETSLEFAHAKERGGYQQITELFLNVMLIFWIVLLLAVVGMAIWLGFHPLASLAG